MPNGVKDLSKINPYIDEVNKKAAFSSKADYEWPIAKFAFEVNIGKKNQEVSFQTMDGLGTSISMMEFRDGNSLGFFKQRRPTLTSFDNVTLKKGMFIGDKALFDWYKHVSTGTFWGDLRTVTINLIDWSGGTKKVLFKWTLDKAFVVKFTPTSLDGEAENEVAVEELELAYQSFTMDTM